MPARLPRLGILLLLGGLAVLPAQAVTRAPLAQPGLSDSTALTPGRLVLGAGGGFGRNLLAVSYRLSYQTPTYAVTMHLNGHGDAVTSGFWSEFAVLYGMVLPSRNATVTLSAGLAYLEGSNNADLIGIIDQFINGTEDPGYYAGFSLPVSLAVSEPVLGPIGFGGYVFANINPRHTLIGVTAEISIQLDL